MAEFGVMHSAEISKPRFSLPRKLLTASLGAAVVALVGAASDSRSSTASPQLAVVTVKPLSFASEGASGRVRIEIRLASAAKGTFVIGGAISDTGTVKAVQRVASGRLVVTEVLTGKAGTLRLLAVRTCSGGAGTWKVLSGSGAYAGSSGGGAASRGPRCTATRYPVVAVHTGALRTPPPPTPPPLAQPGRFAGGTSQREEAVFDVQPGGRSIAAFGIRYTVRCSPNLSLGGPLSLPGPYAIADDRSFRFQIGTQAGMTYVVAGRFTSSTTAAGTLSLSGTVPETASTRIPCSGEVGWTASQPPPSAPPGTYCGFTLQGPGTCLDVAPTGREVTRFESAVVARCFPGGVAPSEFEIGLTYTGSIPIGGNLGFTARGLAIEGLGSATASISGLFEPAGTVSGSVGLGAFDLDYEGTRYRCFSAVGKYEARRQP